MSDYSSQHGLSALGRLLTDDNELVKDSIRVGQYDEIRCSDRDRFGSG